MPRDGAGDGKSQCDGRKLAGYAVAGDARVRLVCPEGTTERELSQLAADGITRDGWNNFNVFWSGHTLRIGTNRAPGMDFRRPAGTEFVGRTDQTPCVWLISGCPVGTNAAAKIILRWTIGAIGV